MLAKKLAASVAGLTLTALASAQTPNVVADISPIHSLVSQVMEGVGKPKLLIQPEASPHEYTLRPSEARTLSNADIVFWIGEDLTPWLEKSLSTLAGSATKVELLESEGLTLLDFREGATFEAHDHGEEEHDDDHHDEDHHHEHEHDDDHHEEHHDDDHGHHHDGHDPHAWLDPVNAQVWVKEIAATLAKADPDNANKYQTNAEKAVTDLKSLTKRLDNQAHELEDLKFIVFHDAYQYFERRFHVLASGAISISDASDPSPARVSEIRETVAKLGVTCVFTEPQYNANMVKSVFKDTKVVSIGVMDPIGADIPTGKDQYTRLISNLMDSLSQCKQ